MRFALPSLLCAVSAIGCIDPGNIGPDGGRIRVNCETTAQLWPVQVVDLNGAPAFGAEVTAVNEADLSKKVTGTTDARGIFRVDGKVVGDGAVRVTAKLNGLNTNVGRFTFTPSECLGSAAEPRDLRLQLQR